MKFQIGDIVVYNDPLFNEDSYVSSFFLISKISNLDYFMVPLTPEEDDDEQESYLIKWVDSNSKWKKVS